MTLGQRRILYLGFIVFFVVVAPFIALYAAGWRYNFRLNRWQETGGIVVVTEPKDATVVFDGKPLAEHTPTRINRLLPGFYTVDISLPGYHPWSKQFEVQGGVSVFLKGIQLFKSDINPLFIETLPAQEQTQEVAGNLALNNFFLELGPQTAKGLDLLARHQLTGATSSLAMLPPATYALALSPENWLTAYDSEHELLYLLQLDNLAGPVDRRILLSGVQGWDWSPDGRSLVYNSGLELWLLETSSGHQELLTRLSQPIAHAAWHAEGSYVYYIAADELNVISLLSELGQESAHLARLAKVSKLLVSKEQPGLIYVDAQIGNQQGWFELEVQ